MSSKSRTGNEPTQADDQLERIDLSDVAESPEAPSLDSEATEVEEQKKQRLDLAVDVEKVSACERHVTVTISREDIDRYFRQQFDELVPKAEVPGFRAGRAPRQIIENRFKKQVSDQVKGALLMDSLAQISDEQVFSSISEPDFDYESVTLPDEGPMTFEFNIEVRPDFDLPNWKGLKLERLEQEFSDEDIDKQIGSLTADSTMIEPVDGPAKLGDFVVVNLSSRFEGDVLNRDEELTLRVRPTLILSDAEVKDFGKLMAGAKAGDHKTAKVTIGSFANNEALQGKEIELHFEVLDVKRPASADVDSIAERFEFESADTLRQAVKARMQMRLDYARHQRIREQISQLLTESADWELPNDLLRRQAKRELDRAVIEMRSMNFSEAEILARENRLRHNALERTKTMLKEHFILERIAEQEGITDSPEDYDAEIEKLARQRNDSPRRVRAKLERTGQIDALRNMIIENKVIQLIIEHAQFVSKPYEEPSAEDDVEAVGFAAAGRESAAIPEAKYADAQAEPLPGTIERG